MMVVLLIAAMALGLGYQSLEQWRRAGIAISNTSGMNLTTSLIEGWLTDSLRGLIPIKQQPFKGSAQQLQGTTLNPITSHQGGATSIGWSIRQRPNEIELALNEDGAELVMAIPQAERANFLYQDDDGKWHAEWPPKSGVHSQLPTIIALQLTSSEGRSKVWASAITGTRDPLPSEFEMSADD